MVMLMMRIWRDGVALGSMDNDGVEFWELGAAKRKAVWRGTFGCGGNGRSGQWLGGLSHSSVLGILHVTRDSLTHAYAQTDTHTLRSMRTRNSQDGSNAPGGAEPANSLCRSASGAGSLQNTPGRLLSTPPYMRLSVGYMAWSHQVTIGHLWCLREVAKCLNSRLASTCLLMNRVTERRVTLI